MKYCCHHLLFSAFEISAVMKIVIWLADNKQESAMKHCESNIWILSDGQAGGIIK